MSFKTKSELDLHFDRLHKYKCYVIECKFKTIHYNLYNEHIETHKREEEVKKRDIRNEELSNKYIATKTNVNSVEINLNSGKTNDGIELDSEQNLVFNTNSFRNESENDFQHELHKRRQNIL
jgi:predicted RNase H-like nuclease (RuvC/YqgF family)